MLRRETEAGTSSMLRFVRKCLNRR